MLQARKTHLPLALGAVLIVLAALTRLLPHPPNFTPIEAMALFGGAMLLNRWWAIAITLGAMLLSDLLLGVHDLQLLVYGCLLGGVFLGVWVGPQARLRRVVSAGLISAIGFFLITNFAVWATSGMYTRDLAGLLLCYELALPFFRNSVAALAVYGLALFGAAHLYQRWATPAAARV